MTEEHVPRIPDAETEQTDTYRDTIYQKLDSAWGSNVGDQGFADPHEVAERAYDAIHDPHNVGENMDARKRAANPGVDESDLPSHNMREKTKTLLSTPIETQVAPPDREEFVNIVAEAILQKADVGSQILEGAREQIEDLIENGDRPAIWSAGYPEHQHRKLGKTGLHDSEASADITPPVEISQEFGAPIELPTVIAPDKGTTEAFDKVRAIINGDQAVVVDDRVGNLTKFLANVPETKAAIWLQYGAHAQKQIDKLARGENPELARAIGEGRIVPIASIDQLTDKIEELRDAGILSDEVAAIFFDYDDTLSDNAERRKLELAAAVDAMFENNLV